MPEPSLPNSANTPPPALHRDLEPDADSFHENFVTVSTDESFILPPSTLSTSGSNGESTNENDKIPSRFQPKDSETILNENLGYVSPTLLQEEELAAVHKNQDNEEKDESGDAEGEDMETQANDEEQGNSFIFPNTVRELTADNGVKVYLVGTAHFSKESQEDVTKTIQTVQPSTVILELCELRRHILEEETIEKEVENLTCESILLAFRVLGLSGALLLIMSSITASFTKQLGTPAGGEFRVAHREAQKIPGCGVMLGDREIHITLYRIWSALSIMDVLGLGFVVPLLLFKKVEITKEEVEGWKENDVFEKLVSSTSGKFPKIMRVLVDERDMFLSHTIRLVALGYDPRRLHYGKTEMKGPVVAVVGLAHIPGIIKYWGKVTEEEFEELRRIPKRTLTSIVIGKTVKFSVYAVLAFGAYKCSKKLFNFPSEAEVKFSVYAVLAFGAYKCSKKLFNFPSDQFIQSTVDRVLRPIQKLSDRLWPTKK